MLSNPIFQSGNPNRNPNPNVTLTTNKVIQCNREMSKKSINEL